MINWKVRIRNKMFWLAIVPAVLLLAQTVAGLFGFSLDVTETQDRVLNVVNAAFAVLAVIGVVEDPTTVGMGDSLRAKGYDKPFDDEEDDTDSGEN